MRIIAGTTTIHKLIRFPNSTKDPDVILEIMGIHRKIGRYQKQLFSITSKIYETLIRKTEPSNRSTRDRANQRPLIMSVACSRYGVFRGEYANDYEQRKIVED